MDPFEKKRRQQAQAISNLSNSFEGAARSTSAKDERKALKNMMDKQLTPSHFLANADKF